MFDGIGNFLLFIWYGFLITGVLSIILTIFLIFMFIKNPCIKTNKLIKPKIELVIKNNKIDTLYIYKNE